VPEPVVPELVVPEPVVPEAVVPEPSVEEPVVIQPIVTDPVAAEPVAAEPVAAEPVAIEPVAENPVVVEPADSEPAVAEPIIEEPVTGTTLDESALEPDQDGEFVNVVPPKNVAPVSGEFGLADPVIVERPKGNCFKEREGTPEPVVTEPFVDDPAVLAEPAVVEHVAETTVVEAVVAQPAVEPIVPEPAMKPTEADQVAPILAKSTDSLEAPLPSEVPERDNENSPFEISEDSEDDDDLPPNWQELAGDKLDGIPLPEDFVDLDVDDDIEDDNLPPPELVKEPLIIPVEEPLLYKTDETPETVAEAIVDEIRSPKDNLVRDDAVKPAIGG